jgi:hypothetical protein
MLIQPIDYFLVVWFCLAAASTVYVGVDQYRNNPEPVVMKWGFILVTLMRRPLGLLLYVMADKTRPGEHENFIKPLWRQGVGRRSTAWRRGHRHHRGGVITQLSACRCGRSHQVDWRDSPSGFHLPVAVHERHDGWDVPGERAMPELSARVHQHEPDDGGDGASDVFPDDGRDRRAMEPTEPRCSGA